MLTMSAIRLNVPNVEYDAAQALLDLHSNIRESTASQSSIVPRFQPKEDMERAAKLFLSCIIASKSPTATSVSLLETNNNKNNAVAIRFPATLKNEPINEEHFDKKNAEDNISTFYHQKQQGHPVVCRKSDIKKTRPMKIQRQQSLSPNTKESPFKKQKLITRDIATQTDDLYHLPKIEDMEATIKRLCEKIKSLEAQIERAKSQSAVLEDANQHTTEDDEKENDTEEMSSYEWNQTTNNYNTTFHTSYSQVSSVRERDSNCGSQTKENSKTNDIVPIGDGHASVPSRLLRHINWNSYTSATRKLLTAVFTRRVLATHSLTGKPSPAFPNKPAKKKLNSALVNDIVQTVVEKCCVPENVVRTSITTKCADESKMYRTRQKNIKKRKHKINRENIPPDTSDSDDF